MGSCSIKKQSISRLDFASISPSETPQSPTLVFPKRKDQSPDFHFVDEIIQPTNILEENYLKYYKQIECVENVNLRKNFLIIQHLLTNQIFFAEVLDQTDKTISYINKLCNLHHQNLLDLVEIYFYSHQYIVIKQYCNGGNLEQVLIQQNKQFSCEQQLNILKQIFSIVFYLHNVQLTHGSLTLKSIEFENQSDDLKIKLVDLDYTLISQENSRIKTHYASPQMASAYLQNEKYETQQSDDIWALGIIGTRLIFNQFLYEGNSLRNVLENICNNKRQGIQVNDSTHHYLADQLFSKMLEYDEDGRIDIWQIQDSYFVQSITEIKFYPLKNKKIIYLCHIFLFMMSEIFDFPQQSYLDQLRSSKKIQRFQLAGLIRKHFKHIYSHSDSLFTVNHIFQEAQNITYFELIAKFTDKKSLITKSRLVQAFKKLCNNQNVIQLDDLLPFFQGREHELRQAFESIENQQINQVQFTNFMFSYLRL